MWDKALRLGVPTDPTHGFCDQSVVSYSTHIVKYKNKKNKKQKIETKNTNTQTTTMKKIDIKYGVVPLRTYKNIAEVFEAFGCYVFML